MIISSINVLVVVYMKILPLVWSTLSTPVFVSKLETDKP